MRRVSGFTLIELIIVIAILAVLAATAVPRFVDLTESANDAAIAGVAGGLESGSAINFAVKLAGATSVTLISCAQSVNVLTGGAIPAGYSLRTDAAAGPLAQAATRLCTIEKTANSASSNATFTIIGVT